MILCCINIANILRLHGQYSFSLVSDFGVPEAYPLLCASGSRFTKLKVGGYSTIPDFAAAKAVTPYLCKM